MKISQELRTMPGLPLPDGTSGRLEVLRAETLTTPFGTATSAPTYVDDCYLVASIPAFLWIWLESDNKYFFWNAGEGANPSITNPGGPAPTVSTVRIIPFVAGAQTIPIRLSLNLGTLNFGLSLNAETFTPLPTDHQVMCSFVFTKT